VRYLNIKLRRDLLRNWTQFFSVFLMAALSVLAFVGLEGAWRGLDNSTTAFVQESNLADSWILATEFTEDDIEAIRNTEGVYDISVTTRLQASVQHNGEDSYLFIEGMGNEDISKPNVVRGADLASDLEGIWIDEDYAQTHDILIGDHIEVDIHGWISSLEVRGTIISPTRMYFTGTTDFLMPNPELFGYGIVTDSVLESQLAPMAALNFMEIIHEGDSAGKKIDVANKKSKSDSHDGGGLGKKGTKGDSSSGSALREAAPEILGERYLSYFDRSTFAEVSYALERPAQLQGLSLLFAFVFVLLSVLAMYTTIRRLIEVQTKDIATLKGLGYSSKSIGFHYASFGLLVGGIGSVVGTLSAPPISNVVLDSQSEFSLPSLTIAYSWTSLLIALAITLICTLSAYWASGRVRRGLPAEYLRGSSAKAGKILPAKERGGFWRKMSYGGRWAWRDGSSNPIRVLMGTIGVAGGMMLLIAGFGMPDSMHGQIENSLEVEYRHTARIRTNMLNTEQENEDLRNELNGQWMQSLIARTTPDDGFNRVLTIFDDGDYIHLQTLEGHYLQQGGVYVTEGFAQAVGLQVGDRLQLRASMDTDVYDFEVRGILASSTPQGTYVHASTWQDAGGSFQPQEMLVGGSDRVDSLRSDPRIEQVILAEEQRQSIEDMLEGLGTIFNLIVFFAVLLVVVVLYNLGALSFTERTRDYATLRVLGFHRREIRALAMRENIVTTLLGWLMGIPLGFWFLGQYVGTFSSFRIMYYPDLSISSFIIASCIVIGCSLATTFLLSRRIRKIDMVEAIKGVE